MLKKNVVQLGNLILSLSDAIDLIGNELAQHQIRTAFIAWQIAEQMQLPKSRVKNIFIAALLHDIGALSTEEKTRIHRFEEMQLDQHCQRGAVLFESNTLLAHLAPIVRYHHQPIRKIDGSIDSDCVLEAQIVNLSDHMERLIDRNHYILHQVDNLLQKVPKFSGSEIHHDVVDAFMQISKREDFWLDLTSPRLYSHLLHYGPIHHQGLSPEDLESVAMLFLKVIDFRSPFTATHTAGVTECASLLAEAFGFTTKEAHEMKIAGMLHDLGKLSIPNQILEKPKGLTREEYAVIRRHTYLTYMVLSSVSGLERIAEWAALHHERLDGSGYPFHIKEDRISTGARIVTVADVFTAMFEDRPYRKGMEWKEIKRIFQSQVDNGFLAAKVVDILFDNYDTIKTNVRHKQALSMDSYEQFLVCNSK